MTVLLGSFGSDTLERAPYSPRNVLKTSFQREWSCPTACPKVSNTTIPRASVMVMRVSTWSLRKPHNTAPGRAVR